MRWGFAETLCRELDFGSHCGIENMLLDEGERKSGICWVVTLRCWPLFGRDVIGGITTSFDHAMPFTSVRSALKSTWHVFITGPQIE